MVKEIREVRAASLRRLLGLCLALCAGAWANYAWAVSVSLTAPPNSVIAAPATITLAATATPGAGRRILRVDFFHGTSRIGTDTSAPYGITWSNVPRGNYILTATAIDSGGSVAISNSVVIRVDNPPTVSLTSPANNAVFFPGANIPLSASAADADEIVTKVEFFSGGALLGTQFLAPYNITWNNVPSGRYTLTAKATDLVGLTTTSPPLTITVDAPPTVAITSPANGAHFVAPATVTVSATAADADGSVAQVEFFDGATPLGTVPTTPGSSTYGVTLANLAAGTHTLTARATDNLGAMTTSVAVTITVTSAVAQIYYIHPDHLNTPRLVADSTGATVWRWDQGEPFGNDVPNNNPSGNGVFEFNLRFPGQYFDRETNLSYNYFRDYDPSVGRYVESDPIGLNGGNNLFQYAANNPNYIGDLDGLAPQGGPGTSGGVGGSITFPVRGPLSGSFGAGTTIRLCCNDKGRVMNEWLLTFFRVGVGFGGSYQLSPSGRGNVPLLRVGPLPKCSPSDKVSWLNSMDFVYKNISGHYSSGTLDIGFSPISGGASIVVNLVERTIVIDQKETGACCDR